MDDLPSCVDAVCLFLAIETRKRQRDTTNSTVASFIISALLPSIMSIEATWELRCNAVPRSLCVFSAASNEVNPFDIASNENNTGALAVVVGTERGSLHYRTFPAPPRSASHGFSSSRSSRNQIQAPLGVAASGRIPSNIPRGYLPVDFGNPLPGVVVAVIRASALPSHHAVFLLLVDDNRGSGASSPGAFAAHLVMLRHGSFSPVPALKPLPRMSCATYHPACGFVYCAGRTVANVAQEYMEGITEDVKRRGGLSARSAKKVVFSHTSLPAPGARSGQDALEITSGGKVAVLAVGNSFYAIAGTEVASDKDEANTTPIPTSESIKILSFAQSSQVHPIIVIDILDKSLESDWSCLFLASGRECAVVDLCCGPPPTPRISSSKPRNGVVTLASPILAASTSWPWIAVLTSDGLVSIRSPSCMAIPLRTVEVGTRPNDYFILRTLREDNQPSPPWMIAISYSGEGKVLQCQPDTAQDLADRMMRLSIDAFGANGFPRSELAEALNASFTATSYVGPEPTANARLLLKQYLEAVLGLADFDGGANSGWPTELSHLSGGSHHGAFDEAGGAFSGRGSSPSVVSNSSPPALITGTALLCLVCSQTTPPDANLANRAAKTCAAKIGVIFAGGGVSEGAVKVCELVADKLLREASNAFSLLNVSSPAPITSIHRSSQSAVHMDFVEAAVWLLRSCGKHERAIDVLYERLQQHRSPDGGNRPGGFWSQIKYESYTATHLSDLWSSDKDQGYRLVLQSPATRRLLESNPRLGLSVFTATHPQNESQWKSMLAREDPIAHAVYPFQVVELLKSIHPAVPFDAKEVGLTSDEDTSGSSTALPLETGRAIAVAFLESALGISTGRPTDEDEFDLLPPDESNEERVANLHDELSYLLLEGVIAERGDDDDGVDTKLGKIYRDKLRLLLRWPLAKLRAERLLSSIPSSFREEHALLLGRLGRHEDALRILYCDLGSLELALEYCDARHERQRASQERERERARRANEGYGMDEYRDDRHRRNDSSSQDDCAYLPLVRVALESDPDSERGTTAAIRVLALRRSAIDRGAALRLLPQNVPVSAVARPFLIPALVDSESVVRRMTVVSSLLRARYISLKQRLTDAQLRAQANLHVVPQLKSLNLGDPLHSTKPFKARPSASASATLPEIMIVKHFFPRHLVIQAKVTNSASAVEGRTLGDVTFVVAESSEEAIQPTIQVSIKTLPFKATGSAWCVLAAAPQRMEGTTAILSCELRYTVLAVDTATGAPLVFGGSAAGMGRTYVEELQDMDVHAAHFS